MRPVAGSCLWIGTKHGTSKSETFPGNHGTLSLIMYLSVEFSATYTVVSTPFEGDLITFCY